MLNLKEIKIIINKYAILSLFYFSIVYFLLGFGGLSIYVAGKGIINKGVTFRFHDVSGASETFNYFDVFSRFILATLVLILDFSGLNLRGNRGRSGVQGRLVLKFLVV